MQRDFNIYIKFRIQEKIKATRNNTSERETAFSLSSSSSTTENVVTVWVIKCFVLWNRVKEVVIEDSLRL